jgi:hypothetical protein
VFIVLASEVPSIFAEKKSRTETKGSFQNRKPFVSFSSIRFKV